MSIDAGPSPRVVVVGLGAVTPFGTSTTRLWRGARDGTVAIRLLQRHAMAAYGSVLGAEVPVMPDLARGYRHAAGHREPAIDFALAAADEAMQVPGLKTLVKPERWAVVAATCNAGLVTAERWHRARGGGRRRRSDALLTTPQALAEALSGAYGLRGPVVSINTACAAGANAIGYAADLIRNGDADAVLAGGSDALSAVVFAGFTSLESLAPEPAAPYSRERSGLSLGEGAGFLVLARADLVEQQGLFVEAEVLGYGLSADGFHPTAPHPEGDGAARAIAAALESAGVRPDEVGYINGHGTGTPKNDVAETLGIRRALGPAADRALVSSTKSMIGHLLGAAGAVEAIVTIRALQEQIAPPTANFVDADPECDLDYVPNVARPFQSDVAVSNNFAFGGANACLVFARPDRPRSEPTALPADPTVITGLAALTSVGARPHVVRAAMERGDRPVIDSRHGIAGVTLEANPYLSQRERRRMDQMSVLAVVAAKLALTDAGIVVDERNGPRIGVVFATGLGPMESMERFAAAVLEGGAGAANPAIFPTVVYNAAAGLVSIHTGAVGPTTTVTAGAAASGIALCYADSMLRAGRADAVLCVAVDTPTPAVAEAYREAGLLEMPGRFLAPTAAAVVLESRTLAQRRAARHRATLLAYGIASDARGIGRWDPQGRGIERSIQTAIDRSGRAHTDVRAVWRGACGVTGADRPEAAALARALPGARKIFAPGLALGDAIGVGAALGLILAVVDRETRAVDPRTIDIVRSSPLGGTHVSLAVGSADRHSTS